VATRESAPNSLGEHESVCFSSSLEISPANGFCNPANVRINVDLPIPFGPMKQVSFPDSNERLIPSKRVFGNGFDKYPTDKFLVDSGGELENCAIKAKLLRRLLSQAVQNKSCKFPKSYSSLHPFVKKIAVNHYETYISTFAQEKKEQARFPRADGNSQRP